MLPAKGATTKASAEGEDAIVTIMLNGEATELAGGLTVAALLDRLALPPAKVAIERNREIVPRSTFADTALADGDVVEVVTFVGGG